MYDVIVVGAGPSGSKTAELCSSLGLNTLLLEKGKVGSPIQCTGLFSHRVLELSGVSEDLAENILKKARFYSPKGNFVELKSKKDVYLFDRERFDKKIFKMAKEAGTTVKTSTKFTGYKKNDDHLTIRTTNGDFKTKILIGADGPNSDVAKKSGLALPDDIIIGYQETFEGNFNPDTVELWFGKNVAPDFFAWVTPLNSKTARIGIGCRKNTSKYFNNFIKKRLGIEKKGTKIEGGIIRRGLIKSSVADRVLLVGDAACQVKPYSGGGVIYGLMASHFAANACFEANKASNFSQKFLKKHYDKEWKRVLSPGIRKGFLIDNTVHKLPDWGLNTGAKVSKYFKFWLERADMDLI